ncbi:MAG: nucleotidyltransferase domain-containing protein [Firmicutes bacterium]|jgi:predicted nucleotidyltransferase|nr:nucleotidyltransferase domain-containing protein [Bacillota bacterium]MCL5993949.1 nucleotidyltransferase domain-containing protein [Bacillota bacterium]
MAKGESMVEEVLDIVVDRIVKTANPDKIILFGSRSRGQEEPFSDYDLLVLKRGIYNRRALAHQIYRSLVDIAAAVDILVETPEKIEKYQYLRGSVYVEAAKGRVVYER